MPTGIDVEDPKNKIWKPHAKQIEFLQIPDDIDEALYGGAAGGGKTELLLMIPLVRGWVDNALFNGIAFRRSYPELEASLIERSKQWYPLFGGKYNETKHVWSFPSGAKMRFGFIERDDDARAYDTAEFQYIAFDELTHFTEFQYLYLVLQRRRTTKKSGLPAVSRSATNPGNIGNEWVRDRFVKPWRIGGKVLKDPKSGLKRIFIPAKATDNPNLEENYVRQLQAIPSEAERKAKLEGDFWAFTGQVFSEFRTTRYESEPEHACHVIEDPDGSKAIEISKSWWPKFLVIDWGFDHYTWAGWSALTPENRWVLYREYMDKGKRVSEWASELYRRGQYDTNLLEIHLDPSAWQERGLEETIAGQFAASYGEEAVKANNDRIGGKLLLHEFFRWTPKPEKKIPETGYIEAKAVEIWRRYGDKALKAYQDQFIPEPPETNLPKSQILSHCTGVIDVIPRCIYDERPKEGKRSEDVKKFDGDDPYDGYRYTGQAINSYLGTLGEEAAKRNQLNQILAARKNDETDFHIRMQAFEARQASKMVPFTISRRGARFRRASG